MANEFQPTASLSIDLDTNASMSQRYISKGKTKAVSSKKPRGMPEKSAANTSAHRISEDNIDVDVENVDYSIFYSLQDVENYIMEQEISQTTKFILNRICKGFGTADPDVASQKKQRVKWIASGVKFMGKPFLLIGDKRYDCRHGKDKNVAKKVRYNERRKCLVNSGEQQRINNVRKGEQLKMNCPAKIQIRDILVYTEFGVEGSIQDGHALPSVKDPTNSDNYVKHNAQRRLRDRTSARIRTLLEQGKVLQTERQFHVSFPKLEAHKGHEVGQAAGTQQRVDRRIIEHIHKMVSEGVIHIDHMKSRMDEFVSQLFAGKPLPEQNNRRYYPRAKDISNHIQKSMASLMSCRRSRDNLQQLYENLQRENPSDCLYFIPSVEGKSRLVYLHQTAGQQFLLKKQCTSHCILDVKYRDKKSSLPMFLVSVDTDNGCQTVATFILEEESDLTEVITKLKSNIPSWAPCEWTVDGLPDRVSALQVLFPGSTIHLKDTQGKAIKRARKRSRNPEAIQIQQPPKSAGETLRDLLSEFSCLSDTLPPTSETWQMISSLDSLLQQARTIAAGSNSTVTATSKHSDSTETVNKSPSKSLKRNSEHESLWEVPPVKLAREDTTSALTSNSGLSSIVQAVDQMSRTQHDLLADHQPSHNYMNPSQQLLAPSLVQPHYPQAGVISQQSIVSTPGPHLPSSSTATHGLLSMNPTSNLSLQVAGMLSDGYHLHNNSSIGNMYGQLPSQHHRQYLDLQQESQTFVQQMAKIGSEQ